MQVVLTFSSAASAAYWLDVNGIVAPPEVEALPDTDPDDGSTIERSTWRGAPGRVVVLYAVQGGGHAMPRGIAMGSPWLTGPVVGRTNRDVHGADEIWAFLSQHRR